MAERISIIQWIKNYDKGMYDKKDFNTQCDAGWYDWFCKESSLLNKTKKLAPKVKIISKLLGDEFSKSHYVFFKNNCPVFGSLYDDFRFCDLKTGNIIYTIVPKSGYKVNNGQGEVWGKSNDFDGPLFQGMWEDIIVWFSEVKNDIRK